MKVSARANSDLASGAVFICCGAVLLVAGRNYPIGTMMRVGPGFFPLLVGAGLIIVGLVEVGRGLIRGGTPLGNWDHLPLLIVSVSFFVFAFLVERVGLIITGVLVMALTAFAGPDAWKPKQLAVIIVAPILAAVVFIYILNVPLRVWP